MSAAALSRVEVAAELGLSMHAFKSQWRGLVARQQIPAPIDGDARAPMWNAAQLYAFIDRDLPPDVRAAAAAYRAAARAYVLEKQLSQDPDNIAAARARLDARFAKP